MKKTKFIVKESQFGGTYANPYRKGGRGLKWLPWKTKSQHDTLREAIDAAVVRVGLARRAVFYRGERLTDGQQLLSGLSIDGELRRLAVKQWPTIANCNFASREDALGQHVHEAVQFASSCDDCDLIGAIDDLEATLVAHAEDSSEDGKSECHAAEESVEECFLRIHAAFDSSGGDQ